MKELRHLKTMKNKRNLKQNGFSCKTIKMQIRLCCIHMIIFTALNFKTAKGTKPAKKKKIFKSALMLNFDPKCQFV